MSAVAGPSVAEAADEFLAGLKSGATRQREGYTYKPSTVRGYERDLRKRVVPALGPTRIARLTRADCQRWVDTLLMENLAASTVRNAVAALRAVVRWAELRGLIHANPCSGLRLPTGGEERDRIASPSEAAALIAALPPRDQAALGLAVYAGLRIGEILALEVAAIDLDALTVDVRRNWDPDGRAFVATKSRRTRIVPINRRLASLLTDHLVLKDHPSEGLLFPGRNGDFPMHPRVLRQHAGRAWQDAGLKPLGFHEGRHTFASTSIAAGVTAKALSSYMGHASISITLDLYGHLMPGNEAEARGLLDAYLDRENG